MTAQAHLKGGQSSSEKKRVIDQLGGWRYICEDLANFNPDLSDQFYDTPHLKVARSWVAKRVSAYIPPKQ